MAIIRSKPNVTHDSFSLKNGDNRTLHIERILFPYAFIKGVGDVRDSFESFGAQHDIRF